MKCSLIFPILILILIANFSFSQDSSQKSIFAETVAPDTNSYSQSIPIIVINVPTISKEQQAEFEKLRKESEKEEKKRKIAVRKKDSIFFRKVSALLDSVAFTALNLKSDTSYKKYLSKNEVDSLELFAVFYKARYYEEIGESDLVRKMVFKQVNLNNVFKEIICSKIYLLYSKSIESENYYHDPFVRRPYSNWGSPWQ